MEVKRKFDKTIVFIICLAVSGMTFLDKFRWTTLCASQTHGHMTGQGKAPLSSLQSTLVMNRLGPAGQGLCPFDCWKARPRSLDPNSPFNVLICIWMIEYICPLVALYSGPQQGICWVHQNAFQGSLTCLQTFYYHTIDRLLHLLYKFASILMQHA